MAAKQRRIGIIGIGFGATVHAPGFRSEGWDVAAICSRHADKAKEAAAAAGIPDVHTDAMELIRRDDLDAVSIVTPPVAHHDLAIAALEAGKHVLCEKPFALDRAQATRMEAAAAASGRTAMVAHEFRYAPQRAHVKQLLGEGHIGKFELCTVELFLDRYAAREPRPFTWLATTAAGGGILGALGSHYIDALRHWFGDVATVSGRVEALRPDLRDPATGRIVQGDADDTFAFTLTFKNGGMATMVSSFAFAPTRGGRIAVMGNGGTLLVDQAGPNPTEDGVVVASRDGAALAPLPMPAQYRPFADARDHRLSSFRLLVRDFNAGIERGSAPAPNFTDGLRCQEVLDAVRESSATGRTITLA
jgi:predicted dehydrogenase